MLTHPIQAAIPARPPAPRASCWEPLTVGWHSGCPTCTDPPPGLPAEQFYWKRREKAWPCSWTLRGGGTARPTHCVNHTPSPLLVMLQALPGGGPVTA